MMNYFPWIEVGLGVLLLAGPKLRWVAVATAVLLCMFIGAMGITYARGIEADCGCFGSGDRISPLSLLRDSAFLIPALFLIFEPRIRARQRTESNPAVESD
jgi:uncharacterized membrane protein YphA (DoxX/SURF4 family)